MKYSIAVLRLKLRLVISVFGRIILPRNAICLAFGNYHLRTPKCGTVALGVRTFKDNDHTPTECYCVRLVSEMNK